VHGARTVPKVMRQGYSSRTMQRFLAVALACAALGAPGCKEKKVEAAPEVVKIEADVVLTGEALEAAGLEIGTARLVPRRSNVVVAGTLEFVPNRVARVGPLIDGRIASIRVDPGQKVTPGTVLATVESVEIGRARADFMSSQVKMEFAERERQRQYRLADGGLTTGQNVVNAETERQLADLESRAAAERLRAVGVRTEDMRAAGAGSGRPSTGMTLTTPLGGLVLDVNARIGQAVKASDTLFVVGEIDKVWLIVDVYERDLSRVHVGDEARARVVAYPDRVFSGKVDYVGGVVDPVHRAVAARIVLDNPDGALRPGMSASSHIFSSLVAAGGVDSGVVPDAQVLAVPHEAVVTMDGQPFVFIEKAKGKFTMRAVERGSDVEGETEITKGLVAGDKIAVKGTFILKSEALREQMGKND
jgi:cobalt-zinc-cadmium efflux system membrane fusion protein